MCRRLQPFATGRVTRRAALEHSDLSDLAADDSTATNAAKLRACVAAQRERAGGGSFRGACVAAFGRVWCGLGLRLLLGVCLTYVQPLLLRRIVRHIEGVDELAAPAALGCAAAMFAVATASSVANAMFWWGGDRLGVWLQASGQAWHRPHA